MMRAMPWAGLLITLVLLAGGCGESDARPACRVAGTLLVNGKPAGRACVRFHRQDDAEGMLLPEATWTEPDGTFSLPVREAGDYALTVYWPTFTEEDGEEVEGQDRFGGRFNDQNSPFQTISVSAGENELAPIQLSVPGVRR